jgi:hypothetical protein
VQLPEYVVAYRSDALGRERLLAGLLAIGSLSYLQALTHPLNEKIALGVYLLVVSVLLASRAGVLRRRVGSFLPLVSVFLVGALVSIAAHLSAEAISFFKSLVYLAAALGAWACLSESVKALALRQLTWIAVLAVVCIAAGAIYASHGGVPQFSTANLDGKVNQWYLSTFSRENYGGVIRPAWIFDEPGTLSYFLTCIAVAREFAGMRRFPTLVIVLGGLISYSTAQLVIAVLYVMYLVLSGRGRWMSLLRPIVVLLVLLLATIPTSGMMDDLYENSQYLSRIDRSQGLLTGNNRATQVRRFLDNAGLSDVAFGNPKCQDKYDDGRCRDFGDQTSNIFTPVFYGGLLYALPFYLLLLYLLARVLLPGLAINHRVLLVIFLALQLQRPYFYTPTYLFLSLFAMNWAFPRSRVFPFFVMRSPPHASKN